MAVFSTMPPRKLRIFAFDPSLRPGAPLLINKLAEQLAISSIPVREAMTRLAAEGLITAYPRRGYFANVLRVDELVDLYETSFLLLKHGLERSGTLANDARVTSWMTRETPKECTTEALVLANALAIEWFYERIVSMTGNSTMMRMLRHFLDRTHIIRVTDIGQRKNFDEVSDYIVSLLDHLKVKNSQAAVTSLEHRVEEKIRRLPALIGQVNAHAFAADISVARLPSFPA